jgi:hypothetical protein
MIDEIMEEAVWVGSGVRHTNNAGTVLASSADAGTGEAIPDVYTITLSGVAGGTGTFTVNTQAPNNPWKGRVKTGVALDGVTARTDIIPGVSLVPSALGANTNTATVRVGVYEGTLDAYGPGAGIPTDGVRHRVTNDGTGAVSEAVAHLDTQAIYVRLTGSVFEYVEQFAPGATEKTAGGGSSQTVGYSLTASAVSGAGEGKVATISVDGAALPAASVVDLSNGDELSGVGLRAVAGQAYRVQSGPLTGLVFAIDPDVANGDDANILIFPSRYVQLAPDNNGGAEPVTGWGTDDVPLTQAGEDEGVILPAGVAYYWTRINVPVGALSRSNPYPGLVDIRARDTGGANWLG